MPKHLVVFFIVFFLTQHIKETSPILSASCSSAWPIHQATRIQVPLSNNVNPTNNNEHQLPVWLYIPNKSHKHLQRHRRAAVAVLCSPCYFRVVVATVDVGFYRFRLRFLNEPRGPPRVARLGRSMRLPRFLVPCFPGRTVARGVVSGTLVRVLELLVLSELYSAHARSPMGVHCC